MAQGYREENAVTFGPRRILTKSLRTVRVVCGDRFGDRRASGGTRVLDACPHLFGTATAPPHKKEEEDEERGC